MTYNLPSVQFQFPNFSSITQPQYILKLSHQECNITDFIDKMYKGINKQIYNIKPWLDTTVFPPLNSPPTPLAPCICFTVSATTTQLSSSGLYWCPIVQRRQLLVFRSHKKNAEGKERCT